MTTKEFMLLAKAQRLRMRRDEDGQPMVLARRKRYRGLKLGHWGEKVFGLSDCDVTERKAEALLAKLRRVTRDFDLLIHGDGEWLALIPWDYLLPVCTTFGMVKKVRRA